MPEFFYPDPGQQIAKALTGFGATLLELARAHQALKTQERISERSFQIQLINAQMRAESAEIRRAIAEQRMELNKLSIELARGRVGEQTQKDALEAYWAGFEHKKNETLEDLDRRMLKLTEVFERRADTMTFVEYMKKIDPKEASKLQAELGLDPTSNKELADAKDKVLQWVVGERDELQKAINERKTPEAQRRLQEIMAGQVQASPATKALPGPQIPQTMDLDTSRAPAPSEPALPTPAQRQAMRPIETPGWKPWFPPAITVTDPANQANKIRVNITRLPQTPQELEVLMKQAMQVMAYGIIKDNNTAANWWYENFSQWIKEISPHLERSWNLSPGSLDEQLRWGRR